MNLDLVNETYRILLSLNSSKGQYLKIQIFQLSLKRQSFHKTYITHTLFLSEDTVGSMVWVHERTIPIEWLPLVGVVSANFFADRGCHVVSMTDTYDRILDF
jgi:hypothetical protein